MVDLSGHYSRVIDAILHGQIVPFLGSDINLCGRPQTTTGNLESWHLGKFPPSHRELAMYLDEASGFSYRREMCCPLCDAKDFDSLPEQCPLKSGGITKMALQHVSQYVDLSEEQGPDVLYGSLHHLFETHYEPNPIHRLFATLPQLMRQKGYYPPYPLIVTTCFDRTLEQAFDRAGEAYDLVSFIGDTRGGRFEHQPPGEAAHPIDRPHEYAAISLKQRPAILKLYGGYGENFVITEDHYIDYLAHRDVAELLPANLLAILRTAYVWFLGYNPSYWNLRVILNRIWPEQIFKHHKNWWAVERYPEVTDRAVWNRYNCVSIEVPSLDNYISQLQTHLQAVEPRYGPVIAPGPDEAKSSNRDQVFISYSHQDADWLQKLQVMLKPAIRADKIAIWDDSQIQPGANWRDEIKAALTSAKIAVLLVSAHFLASDFIAEEELPPLLETAQQEGLRILWIYLSACLYQYASIADFQAAHDLSQPLECLSEADQQATLARISEKIIAAFNT